MAAASVVPAAYGVRPRTFRTMLFADIALAARIERAECRLLASNAAAIARARPDAGGFLRELAGGVACYTGPDSPLNKIAGLGFGGTLDEDRLAEVEQAYAERGAPVQVEVATLADRAIAALLTRRGYVLQGHENVLGLPLPRPERPPVDGVEVAPVGDDDGEAWISVLLDGFATPDGQGVGSHESFPRAALEQILRDLACTASIVRYLARRAGVPAGGASMAVTDGIAQLCGAATLPAHRRRGVQAELLRTRLAEAGALGSDVAVITTEPGSKSQQNAARQGFALLYSRAVLVRAPG